MTPVPRGVLCCSLWLTCPCFEPRLTDSFSLPWCIQISLMLVFKFLPLTCIILAYHVCSSLSAQPFLPVFVPPLLVVHELIFSYLQAKHCSGLLGFLYHARFLLLSLFSVQTVLASALSVMHILPVPPACLFESCILSPSPRK